MVRPWIKFMKLANALRKVLKKTLHTNVKTAVQIVGGIVDRAATHEQLVCYRCTENSLRKKKCEPGPFIVFATSTPDWLRGHIQPCYRGLFF